MAQIINLSNKDAVTPMHSSGELAGMPDASMYFGDADVAAASEYAQRMSAYNNAWSASQAQRQMDFQERLSSTAHQREVADLKAAGLNPVLSANGQGAATTTGAKAESDNTAASVASSVLQAATAAEASMENARISAATSIAIAQIQAETARQSLNWQKQQATDFPDTWPEFVNLLFGNNEHPTGSGVLRGLVNNMLYGGKQPNWVNSGSKLGNFVSDIGSLLLWMHNTAKNGLPSEHSSSRRK